MTSVTLCRDMYGRILFGALTVVLLPSHLAIASEANRPSAALAPAPLSSANLIETLLGLVFVLAVMLLIAWLVKRFMQVPGFNKGQVQVLGGVSLGAREKAVLLAVDGRRLLVGVAPGRVQTLAELGTEEPATPFARELEHASSEATGRSR